MSPFEIFRRNLKPLMVFLTGLALFAFVVLPAMDSYMRRGGGGGGADAELASFDGKPLRRSRVANFTQNHNSTVRFLRELAEETIRRGGAPSTPGFAYDSQTRTIQSIGIDERPSELSTVRTLQFANEAKKAGFELDDTAIGSWLFAFTDQGLVPENEMYAMLMQSTRNQMGKYHLFEQLRSQLLAELYQRGNMSGLSINGQFPVVTPVEQWENFLKLNRKATSTAYGVLVADYLDETNESPTESAIEEVYEAGKDRYPNEQSAEPAFRRRDTAMFEYVVADQLAAIESEAKNFSDDVLRAEYEKRLAGGDFQMPETGSQVPETEDALDFGDENDATDSDTEPEDEDVEKADAPMDDEKGGSKPDTESAGEPTDDKSDKEASDESEEKSEAEDQDDEDQPSEEDQSSFSRGSAVRLVAFQADENSDDTKSDNGESSDNASTDKDDVRKGDAKNEVEKPKKKKADQAEEDKPKKNKQDSGDAKQKDRDAQNDSDKKADAEKGEKESSIEKGSDKQDGEAMKTDAKDSKPVESTAEEKTDDMADEETKEDKPAAEAFEDVRERIARELAAPIVRQRVETATNDIAAQMKRYFALKSIHESNLKIDRPSEAPTKPDLKALAKKYDMQYEAIGPHDIVSLRNEPIAQSSEFSGQMSQPGPSFTEMMFGVSSNQSYVPKQQLFSPLRTTDMASGKTYVAWKTEETEAYTPTLDEVRDEVVMAIRTEEARELARVEAVRLADEANEGKDLASLIPEDKKSNLLEGLGPYSWMMSFGFGGAFLGNVPELDSVGEEFMAETFRTSEGEYGVAANLPERVVYVIKPTGFQPSVEELRRRFKQPRERMMALMLGAEDANSVMRGFYESVDERTGFNYVAPEQE